MKRIAVFASYSKDGIIAEYVLYYLRGLKKVVSDIIFIADNEVLEGEEKKIDGLVTYCKCERHGCYDFGSYRRGFEWAEKNGILKDADELIFCNDSCYGPIFPFEEVFTKMESRNCDFWGLTESHFEIFHVQSYFLVFKKNVFSSHEFIEFVNSFERQNSFWDYVTKYELHFADTLIKAGFKADSYTSYFNYNRLNPETPVNPMLLPVENIELRMPLLKRKITQNDYDGHLEESLLEIFYHISTVNEKLFLIIIKDTSSNITELFKKLYLQQDNIHEKLTTYYASQKKLNEKNNKHLRGLRCLIYINIALILALFSLIIYLYFH